LDFGTIIRRSAQSHQDNVAVSFEGREQTYGQLFDNARRLANALSELGVRKSDRVAVLSDNAFETLEIVAACALGGYVISTLYTYYDAETNVYLLNQIDARALLIHASRYDRLQPYLDRVAGLRATIVFGGAAPTGALPYGGLIAAASPEDPQVVLAPDDVHQIRFSSGTTGRPKAIFHTVERWLGNNSEYRWISPAIDERDRYLAACSLAHLSLAYQWGMLWAGATILPMSSFDAARWVDLVERHGVTYTTLVPTMIQSILALDGIESRDLSSLRCLTYAGAPISAPTQRRAIKLFGDVLHHYYAMSEVAPVTMLLPHEHRPDGNETEQRRTRSVGRASFSVSVTIVDDAGRALGPGEIGEVAVQSPGAMSGIWNDDAATKARFLPDGSLLTRDMGYLDEGGYLFLVDRKDDMIISGGYNIWPVELEQVLVSHEDVVEVCVVGVPHPRWGETPKAVVVVAEGATVTEEELIELTRARLGAVKKITSVEFAAELPRTATGKVQRAAVRSPYWQDAGTKIGGA
jgi:acyl-coenzyme A synthetase/AMP-(fatty) acid ligase